MPATDTFNLDVPMLFAYVNSIRTAKGLQPVEPAVMAVRSGIKFAVGRHKLIDLRTARRLELSERDVQHLCTITNGLFDVQIQVAKEADDSLHIASQIEAVGSVTLPRTHGPQLSAPQTLQAGKRATLPSRTRLPLAQFYAAVNKARRAALMEPVEPAIIAVRTGVKFAILRRRPLSIDEDHVVLDDGDAEILGKIVAQLFGVHIPDGVRSLCRAHPRVSKNAYNITPSSSRTGLLSQLMSRLPLRRRASPRQTFNVNNLVLAILAQRAVVGHKIISPSAIRLRCANALASELGIELHPEDTDLTLTDRQAAAFARIVRREFQILFSDLPTFVARSGRP